MKILMVNKFLHPNGGSETYIFKLGDYLANHGHQVQYFGMDHEKRIVGNDVNAYTASQDFHSTGLKRFLYPVKVIYSVEARRKIRLVLDNFGPDVVHLNNFNFQLTPSIIYEIRKYQRQTKKKVKIVFTAHDYQLICPNHMMFNLKTKSVCEKCIDGNYSNCIKDRCIHKSRLKSILGAIEGKLYGILGTYKYIDAIICPSNFIAGMLNKNPILRKKTSVIHNFIDIKKTGEVSKEDYIIYFGRFSQEKGILTLLDAVRKLPDVKFIFAGTGPLESELSGIENLRNVGFKSGDELEELVQKARFSIYPSEWYENCPFSVMESQMLRTPVLGANIGGIPELIEVGITGELFSPMDHKALIEKIKNLWGEKEITNQFSKNCEFVVFDTLSEYSTRILEIYSRDQEVYE